MIIRGIVTAVYDWDGLNGHTYSRAVFYELLQTKTAIVRGTYLLGKGRKDTCEGVILGIIRLGRSLRPTGEPFFQFFPETRRWSCIPPRGESNMLFSVYRLESFYPICVKISQKWDDDYVLQHNITLSRFRDTFLCLCITACNLLLKFANKNKERTIQKKGLAKLKGTCGPPQVWDLVLSGLKILSSLFFLFSIFISQPFISALASDIPWSKFNEKFMNFTCVKITNWGGLPLFVFLKEMVVEACLNLTQFPSLGTLVIGSNLQFFCRPDAGASISSFIIEVQ